MVTLFYLDSDTEVAIELATLSRLFITEKNGWQMNVHVKYAAHALFTLLSPLKSGKWMIWITEVLRSINYIQVRHT